MYDDAQIGAAVRSIHEGSRKALREHVTLEPIFDDAEGSTVTVAPGLRRTERASDWQRGGRSAVHGGAAAPWLACDAGRPATAQYGTRT